MPPKPATKRTKKTDAATPKQRAIISVAQAHPAMTTREIGKLTDTDHSTVVRTLNRYGIDTTAVEGFKNRRADVFAGLQDRLLASCTDEDIKKAPLGSRVLAAAQLYDKERLERGQSTDNVNVLVAGLRDLQARQRERSSGAAPDNA